MKAVIIAGSPRADGNTQHMMRPVYEHVAGKDGWTAVWIDLASRGIEMYRGPDQEYGEETKKAVADIMEADAWIIGSPVYNSFFSSAVKNIFEFADYKKTAGKAGGIAVMGSERDALIRVHYMLADLLAYFGAIGNPKAVRMTAKDIGEGNKVGQEALGRLISMADGTLELASKIRK